MLVLLLYTCLATGQDPRAAVGVTITVVDETGNPVAGAQVAVEEPRQVTARLWTDYKGNCAFPTTESRSYSVHITKAGFYEASADGIDASQRTVRIVLAHVQIVREQVNVTASQPGIDTQQVSNLMTMNTPEIVNIPFHTSRDIRYLLPFYPGVVQGTGAQVHLAGSETWEALDTLDGFDIRSPARGTLDMRVSTDAVRSIDVETTRYPVEFGRATGGVVAYYTGMGDNKFRFNMTNFIPSLRDLNGIRFDKFVPRFTFSGPLKRDRAWFYDGVEAEYDNIYITELPVGANTNSLTRGSNMLKVQSNLGPSDILNVALLFNTSHSLYSGLSSMVPQQSTVKRDIQGWLPYLRNQWSFGNGAVLDVGVAQMRYRDGYEPHGSAPYEITPETTEGSYFEKLTGRAQRWEGTAAAYWPERRWLGSHDLKTGLDLDHVAYDQDQVRAPVSYLREDGTMVRRSTFASSEPFTLRNEELGAYIGDRWAPAKGWLLEPGVRFDWDAIVRRPLIAPRLAAVYAPTSLRDRTKISAGIGLYYEQTYLLDLAQGKAGNRNDTFFASDGVTPTGSAQETTFTVNESLLQAPRAVNWSIGAEQALPWSVIAGANFMQKRTSDAFTFANQGGTAAELGTYLLTNGREDRYRSEEVDARKSWGNDYSIFAAYTHSSARTNAALNYLPTPSPLGAQQSGPQAWDTPNRLISWGWMPLELPWFRKNWDFVYLLDWHSGVPYTAVDAAGQLAGEAGGQRFPHFVDFSPGAEWRFHFRGQYWGLRGVIENATGSLDPAVVNNVVDSPSFGTFSVGTGRAVTARIRLIETK